MWEASRRFSLIKRPLYYALSHTWGLYNRDQAINIDKKAFMVSKSLACALQRLKELAVGSSALNPPEKHVWIENICINQDDLSERANQVPNMGKVYSKAVCTLVWLGPGFSSYTVALRRLRHMRPLPGTKPDSSKPGGHNLQKLFSIGTRCDWSTPIVQ